MQRAKEVVRLTGLSLSTLKRMAIDCRFAAPHRLSPRRIGWPARAVTAWLETVDGARHKANRGENLFARGVHGGVGVLARMGP
jgi:predicted DNA-binding transcriptional regulator AlpA